MLSVAVPTPNSHYPWSLPPLSKFFSPLTLPYLSDAADVAFLAPSASANFVDAAAAATIATSIASDAAASAAMVPPVLRDFG